MKTDTLQFNNNYRKAFWLLTLTAVVLIALYGYFLSTTVINTLERANITKQISTLNQQIGNLEFKYISAKDSINIDSALAMGYKVVKDPKFIQSETKEALSYNSIIK